MIPLNYVIKKWKDDARTKAAKESMSIDCARLWNIAPTEITNAATKPAAKQSCKGETRSSTVLKLCSRYYPHGNIVH